MGFLSKIIGKDQNIIDVLDILKLQHREVDDLIAKLENGEGNRRAVFTELADKLSAHATAEEKVFYPFIMAKSTTDILHESVEEHLAMKRTLSDMITKSLDDDTFHAKLKLLKEQVTHHAHEEEEDKLFSKVKDLLTSEERAGLGNEFIAMYDELLATGPSKGVPNEIDKAATLPTPRR